jgi:uncharacterized protein YwqG
MMEDSSSSDSEEELQKPKVRKTKAQKLYFMQRPSASDDEDYKEQYAARKQHREELAHEYETKLEKRTADDLLDLGARVANKKAALHGDYRRETKEADEEMRGLIVFAQKNQDSKTLTAHMKTLLLEVMARRGLTGRMRSYGNNWMTYALAEPNVLVGDVFAKALLQGLEVMVEEAKPGYVNDLAAKKARTTSETDEGGGWERSI